MLTLQFSSISEFLQMGIYTFHVWSVYALFAVFIGVNIYLPLRQHKQFVRQQKQRAVRDAELAAKRAGRRPPQGTQQGV